MALGASEGEIRRMVLKEGFKMTLIGAGIGLAVAIPLPAIFRAVLDGLRTSDPRTYFTVLVAMFTVAMLATYVPARRASTVDPITALRSE